MSQAAMKKFSRLCAGSAEQSVALPVKFGVHALVGRDSVEPPS
jgi:hypothetical protein